MSAPLTLHLLPHATPVRYNLRTTTTIQVGSTKFENEILYVAEQRVLARNAEGYVLETLMKHSMQKADDLFSRVVADVSQASQRLVVQTDQHGNLVRVENQPEVYQHWQKIRPDLAKKYADEATVAPFLESFGTQLAIPGSMEVNLRHKGLLGALLVGLYGYPIGRGSDPLVTKRRITGFFGEIDLPLALTSSTQPPPADVVLTSVNAAYVGSTGIVDTETFASEALRRLMRDLVDDFKFPVDLQLECTNAHIFDQISGTLLHSNQLLRVEVPGVYYNATAHELVAQPVA